MQSWIQSQTFIFKSEPAMVHSYCVNFYGAINIPGQKDGCIILPSIHNFRCRTDCHQHALFVQPAQTHLSFDIWLMLSRGTAAGHRKQRTGKTVAAWVVSDSSSCCASISTFGILVFFFFFSLFSCGSNLFDHSKCKSTYCSFTGKV